MAAALLLMGGMLVAACDATPGPTPLDRHPPEVSNFSFAPDSVNAADLPDEQITDSTAQVPFQMSVTAQDPDGTVEQVLFTIEPASTPGQTVQGTLPSVQSNQYGAAGEVGLAPGRDEIYTVRVFAIDDDDQISNQAIAQLRFVPRP